MTGDPDSEHKAPANPRDPEESFRALTTSFIAALRVCGQDPLAPLPLDEELLIRFLRDLWQHREATWFHTRWKAAECLLDGANKAQAATKTGINERVVKNVHDWALGEASTGGLAEVYRRLQEQRRRDEAAKQPHEEAKSPSNR